MTLLPQEKLEKRWRTVQVLFKPNGKPTAWGSQMIRTFVHGLWTLPHATGGRTRVNPEMMTDPVRLGKQDSPAPLMETTAEGWRLVTGSALRRGGQLAEPEDNLQALGLSQHLDPCLSPEETALAFQKEGWGALLAEHPRGCIAFRLSTAHKVPEWEYNLTIEAILILPHPHDQVSEEHKMHAFELEGGGVACWDPDGLTLSEGEVLWGRRQCGGLAVSTQSYALPRGSWQREAMREASVMRGASHGGLTTLGHRLGVQKGAVPDELMKWDPLDARQKRAEALLQEATLTLARAFSEHAFRPEWREADLPSPVRESGIIYQPYEVFLHGCEKGTMRHSHFRLRMQWGTPGWRDNRFDTNENPVWTVVWAPGVHGSRSKVLFVNADWRQTFNLDTEEGFRGFLQKMTQEGLKDLDKLLKEGW